MKMVYQWKPNARIPVEPQVAGKHLEALRSKNGELTPRIVVEDARKKSSPFHPVFDWNDKTAAEQWREEQARYIIRSVVVVSSEEGDEPRTVRAFVSVTDEGDRHYTSIAHAMGDAELREQIVKRASKELQEWRKRYDDLKEFSEVYAAMDKISA